MPDVVDSTERLRAALAVPTPERDAAWRLRFADNVPDARLVVTSASVSRGPDGLPYGRVHLLPTGASVPSTTLRRLADRATQRGYGIVLGATPGANDWVFRYGDLWSLRAYGTLGGDGAEDGHEGATADPSERKSREVLEAAPSETLFPSWARHVIGRFLRERLDVLEPRAKLFVVPDARPSRNLAFNVARPAGPSTREHAVLSAVAGWFLPPGLGMTILPDGASFDEEPSVALLDL